jgi:D-alanyl-D-alanine carboxypeptidase/D-alanyl-D-alanine-endopeptidase (penicillin-binding protein 4)
MTNGADNSATWHRSEVRSPGRPPRGPHARTPAGRQLAARRRGWRARGGFTGTAILLGLALPAFAQWAPTAPEPPLTTLPALQAAISNRIAQPRFAAATWGVKVVSLDTGRTLFEHNAGTLLKPASNAKLFTAALALDRLGPDYRIKTSLYARAKPTRGGTLWSDLVVYGRGDPSFAARFHGGDYGRSLQPLIEAVARTGLRHVRGDLVGDESYFRGPPLGSGWMWDDLQHYYGAEVSALTVEDNVADLVFLPGARVGDPCRILTLPQTRYVAFSNRTVTAAAGHPRRIELHRPMWENVLYAFGQLPLGDPGYTNAVAVHDPARWSVTLLRDALARRGIRVSGTVRTRDWRAQEAQPRDYAGWTELAAVPSPPLTNLLAQMLKPSQNLYAQLLLLQVGAQAAPSLPHRSRTTEDVAVTELHRFLREVGLARGEYYLEEGSGLSREALVTPNAIIRLLQFMDTHRHGPAFKAALPVAGVDGTLRRRLRHAAVAGQVRAKTGTLRSVVTLSGYLHTAAKERLAFCLLLNNYLGDGGPLDAQTTGRQEVDALVLLLAQFAGHTTP